jgi:hypothetical protein
VAATEAAAKAAIIQFLVMIPPYATQSAARGRLRSPLWVTIAVRFVTRSFHPRSSAAALIRG